MLLRGCDLQVSENTAQAPSTFLGMKGPEGKFHHKSFFDKENFCVNIAFGPCRAKSSTSSLCSVTFAVLSLLKAKMP